MNPGYLETVYANELGGRYNRVLEGHGHGFWYYFNNLMEQRFAEWFLLVPAGIIIGFFIKNKKLNRLTLFLFLLATTYLLVISLSQTKLRHYDVPLFPILAMLTATGIFYVFELLTHAAWIRQTMKVNVVPFVFFFLIAITPYQKIFNKTYLPEDSAMEKRFYELGYYLKDATKGLYDLNDTHVLYHADTALNRGINAHIQFYIHMLNQKGIDVSLKDWRKLAPGDVAVAYQPAVKEYVERHYLNKKIYTKGNVITYYVSAKNP